MTGLKAVYLRKRWAGRDIGTRLYVLGPDQDLKRGYVDALRADQLLSDGIAAESKEDAVDRLGSAEPEADASEEE